MAIMPVRNIYKWNFLNKILQFTDLENCSEDAASVFFGNQVTQSVKHQISWGCTIFSGRNGSPNTPQTEYSPQVSNEGSKSLPLFE